MLPRSGVAIYGIPFEIDEIPVNKCHEEVRLNRSEGGHSVTVAKLGSIAPTLLSQLSPDRFDRPEILFIKMVGDGSQG